MSKGVAIPYIIALVIGLVVLVIMVYLIFRTDISERISLTECKSRLTEICRTCKNTNWGNWPNCNVDVDKPFFYIIRNCSTLHPVEFGDWGSVCSCSDMKNKCKVLGVDE